MDYPTTMLKLYYYITLNYQDKRYEPLIREL